MSADSAPRRGRLTQQVETGVENGQRGLVVVRFPHGFHEHGHVTAEVVHPEQERADGGRPDRHRHGLHEYGEQDAEPHFRCENINNTMKCSGKIFLKKYLIITKKKKNYGIKKKKTNKY